MEGRRELRGKRQREQVCSPSIKTQVGKLLNARSIWCNTGYSHTEMSYNPTWTKGNVLVPALGKMFVLS
jgi:hypothetical protein